MTSQDTTANKYALLFNATKLISLIYVLPVIWDHCSFDRFYFLRNVVTQWRCGGWKNFTFTHI